MDMRSKTSYGLIISYHYYYSLVLLLLITTGCAIQQPLSENEKTKFWESHKDEISRLNAWRLAGRISVRHENEAWSASLYWQQNNDEYKLSIVAPLASGSVEIYGDTDSVSLKTREGQVYADSDVELLMRENLGWSVPISAMGYWIKGMPEPVATVDQILLDDTGKLAELNQSDWQVIYQAYTRSGGYRLPSRLQISRVGTTVRLIINSWNIPNG